jgi:hypothetical protein
MTSITRFEMPKPMPSIEDAIFYHTIDLPGFGTIKGNWDLRGHVDDYLGHVDVRGKRVLDVGTATGFIGFEAERRGAEVIAFDMGEDEPYDPIPYYHELTVRTFGGSREFVVRQHKKMRIKMHNGFWFCYHALKSSVKVRYGSAYDIPEEIGDVDIAFFGAILLHIRDPLTAIESASKLTKEAIIITEPMFHATNYDLPTMMLVPNIKQSHVLDTYWQHTPAWVSNFLQILGFTETTVNYHHQIYNSQNGTKVKFFTVVGRKPYKRNLDRTVGNSIPDSSNDLDLKHILDVPITDYRTKLNEPINIEVIISNVGSTKWLHKHTSDMGVVKLGMHLYDSNKNLIDLDFFRSLFDEDILPGQKVTKRVSVIFPNKGTFYLGVDLVSELVCWFENVGNNPIFVKVTVQ